MTEQDRNRDMPAGDMPEDDTSKQGGTNQPGQGGGIPGQAGSTTLPGPGGTGTMGRPGTTPQPGSTGSPDPDDPGMGREGDDTERRPSG